MTKPTENDHAVPDGAQDQEPKGTPTSDRHHAETAHDPRGGKPTAPKHSYAPEPDTSDDGGGKIN